MNASSETWIKIVGMEKDGSKGDSQKRKMRIEHTRPLKKKQHNIWDTRDVQTVSH